MLEASTSRPAKPRAASSRSRTAVPRSLCDDVVGDVADVDAEPDHRRLVADGATPRSAPRSVGGVAHVAVDELHAVG